MSEPILISLIGLGGAVIGSLATIAGSVILFCLKERARAKRDAPQRKLLLSMLENPTHNWRKIDILMHVIRADERTTKNLLLTIGARASEDGQQLWGLIKRNPLP